MITVRQIQRFWQAKTYDRLLQHLLAPRPEASARLEVELTGAIAAAALSAVRLDELSQSYVPLYTQMIRTVLAAQQADGGWGDAMTTALCVRALGCGRGNGAAMDRGLAYLAALQRDDGLWPGVPVRRMPSDPFASAFVLLQLGDRADFRDGVRFDASADWFEANDDALDPATAKLWRHAARRCLVRAEPRPLAMAS